MSERSAFVMAAAPMFLQGSYRKVGRRRNSAIGTKSQKTKRSGPAIRHRPEQPGFAHGVERQGRFQDVDASTLRLNSWTGSLSTRFNWWTELHLNRRQPHSCFALGST